MKSAMKRAVDLSLKQSSRAAGYIGAQFKLELTSPRSSFSSAQSVTHTICVPDSGEDE